MNLAAALAVFCIAAGPLEGRRVIVVPEDDSAGAVDRAEDVTAALQARGLVAVPRDERGGVDGVVIDVDVGDRERARGLLQEGRARFREVDFTAAVASGRAAVAEILRLDRPEDHRELLADTLLFLATVRLAVGRDSAAGEVAAAAIDAEGLELLRLAARLEPERAELDPGLHRPTVVSAWQQARQANADAADSLVVVAPRVVGAAGPASVSVDGVVRAAEGGLLSLKEGPHLVTLRAVGVPSRSRVVDVKDSGTEPVVDTLAPGDASRRRHEAAQQVRDGDAAAFARLGSLVDAPVVVALASAGRPRAGVDGAVKDIAANLDDVAGVASAVVAAFAVVAPPPPPPPPTTELLPLPVWVGLGVGAALAGATVAVVVWLSVPGEAPPLPPRPIDGTCCVP